MKRPLIFEGPDGAGKSTLGLHFAQTLECPLVHTGGPIETHQALADRLAFVKEWGNVIFDRVPHISDPIYGAAAGRDALMHRDSLMEHLASLKPVLVLCMGASQEVMCERMLKVKKDHKSPEHLEMVRSKHKDIYQMYEDLCLYLLTAPLEGVEVFVVNSEPVRASTIKRILQCVE